MSRESDRDRAVEALLRQRIGDPSAPATGECLDGETLAAWSAGRLPASEAAAAERHVADCPRCLATVAAFARATPAPAESRAWWQRGRVRWLVPLATAATVAAVWVALPPQASLDEAQFRDAVPAAPSMPAPPARETEEKSAAESSRRDRPSMPAPGARATRRAEADTRTLAAEAPAASPPLGRTAEGTTAAKQEAPRGLQETVLVAPPAAQAAAPAAPAPLEGRTRNEAINVTAEGPVPAERASPEAAGSTLRKPGVSAFEAAPSSGRWRVAGGRVEHLSRTGARWEPMPIAWPDEPLAVDSPREPVAWIVGRRGLVYLGTDGARFARLPFPEVVDLVGVKATDARQAIVTTVDGRVFRTTDGGRTWASLAP